MVEIEFVDESLFFDGDLINLVCKLKRYSNGHHLSTKNE